MFQQTEIIILKPNRMNNLNIEATDFSQEANIISLDSAPAISEQNELFINDSIILEF